MKLSVVIPVYNERSTISAIVRRVEKAPLPGGMQREIVLVDDASTDGTGDILRKLERHRVLFHARNMGKGAALRTGFRAVTGDIILVQDADMEYSPEDYPKLLQPLLEGRADVVYGSRIIRRNSGFYLSHYFGNKFLTVATNLIYGSHLRDMETCYKVFRRGLLKGITLESNRFDFEPEFTAKVLKSGLRIVSVPVSFTPRTFAAGKKISWKDGLTALWVLIKLRFSSKR
jgi:glycosyltransferase involved in cell wall biosynthesis